MLIYINTNMLFTNYFMLDTSSLINMKFIFDYAYTRIKNRLIRARHGKCKVQK